MTALMIKRTLAIGGNKSERAHTLHVPYSIIDQHQRGLTMASEIEYAIKTLFQQLEIPTDNRSRARKCAHIMSVISAISDHGITTLTESHEFVVDEIKELEAKIYPNRNTELDLPVVREQLRQCETDKQVIGSALELMNCLKHYADKAYKEAKANETPVIYYAKPTISDGM